MEFITTIAKLISREEFTKTSYRVELELAEAIDYIPGQFVNVLVAENVWRSYSIVSMHDMIVSLFVDVKPQGPGSLWFEKSEIGTETTAMLPLGSFALKESKNKKLFIATGTGLAPFIPMIKSLQKVDGEIEVSLYYGVRYDEDFLVHEYFSEEELSSINLVPCITRGKGIIPNSQNKRVTEILKDVDLDFKEYDVYICGNPKMVAEVSEIAKAKGGENIYTERY